MPSLILKLMWGVAVAVALAPRTKSKLTINALAFFMRTPPFFRNKNFIQQGPNFRSPYLGNSIYTYNFNCKYIFTFIVIFNINFY